MTDDERRMTILHKLALAFPQRTFSEEMMALYLDDLSDVPVDRLDMACRNLRRSTDWFPTIAQIRAAAADTPPAEPGEAIAETFREVRRVGSTTAPPLFVNGKPQPRELPTFSHPVIAAAVRDVGWDRICTGEREFVERDLRKAIETHNTRYVAAVQSGDSVTIARMAGSATIGAITSNHTNPAIPSRTDDPDDRGGHS